MFVYRVSTNHFGATVANAQCKYDERLSILNEKENEKQNDILYQDFTLDDDDQTSIITVTATCAVSEDRFPTQLLSVIRPSDFCDQSTVGGL
jgi:hypothetical protein